MARTSIGIPVYNEDRFIGQTLISAIGQLEDYSDLEIVVSDNCSDDNTLMEIERAIDKFPSYKNSIKLLKQSVNQGPLTNFWQHFANPW